MLFSSYEFFVFLAVVLTGWHFADRLPSSPNAPRWSHLWLIAASLFFYAWWRPFGLTLIGTSLIVNWIASRAIRDVGPGTSTARAILIGAIVLNLSGLGFYKYADFTIEIANFAFGTSFPLLEILLPLGISFITFHQIAYLIDLNRRRVGHHELPDYLLYITFFPHMIAGPIVHYREMMPQFAERPSVGARSVELAPGLSLFAIGLAKKTVVADQFAQWANGVFTAADKGFPLTTFEAWIGSLSYTFQLYFDFSGYSDMAVGLALMFGIAMPANFFSPYKATSIIDFWRRWHVTLSRYLRDYLYIPLGGGKKGTTRRFANLLATMLLGGLWHGAGWTFVAWGALHGGLLCANHAWRALAAKTGITMPKPIAWALTFSAVVVGWVYFRAASMDVAHSILGSMAGLDGALAALHGTMPKMAWAQAFFSIVAALAFCLIAPNTAHLFRKVWKPACGTEVPQDCKPAWSWSQSWRWAIAIGFLAWIGGLCAARTGDFLYFNF